MTQVLRTWIKQIEINEKFVSGVIGVFLLVAFFVGVYRFALERPAPSTLSQVNESELQESLAPGTSLEEATGTVETGEVSSAGISKYTVEEGDSLWKIAEKTYNDGYQWVEIAKVNNLANVGLLAVGQELDLPRADDLALSQTAQIAQVEDGPPIETTLTSSQESSEASIETKEVSSDSYTVQQGDYLWKIAEVHLGNGYQWTKIWEMNQEVIANPEVILAGQTLKLPTNADTSQSLSYTP